MLPGAEIFGALGDGSCQKSKKRIELRDQQIYQMKLPLLWKKQETLNGFLKKKSDLQSKKPFAEIHGNEAESLGVALEAVL